MRLRSFAMMGILGFALAGCGGGDADGSALGGSFVGQMTITVDNRAEGDSIAIFLDLAQSDLALSGQMAYVNPETLESSIGTVTGSVLGMDADLSGAVPGIGDTSFTLSNTGTGLTGVFLAPSFAPTVQGSVELTNIATAGYNAVGTWKGSVTLPDLSREDATLTVATQNGAVAVGELTVHEAKVPVSFVAVFGGAIRTLDGGLGKFTTITYNQSPALIRARLDLNANNLNLVPGVYQFSLNPASASD